MKKLVDIIPLCLIVLFLMRESGMTGSKQDKDTGPLGENVIVSPNAIIMPLGRILLLRKDSDYGAIKFTRFWTGKTEDDLYAAYESYYQNDKTGNLTNKNVQFTRGELRSPKPSFSLFGHPFAFGAKKEIRCGPIRLWWTGKGTVYFFERYQREGDYGIEFAPTKWTDISQVNVFDPRLRWYKYNANRKDMKIPVDHLLEDRER